MVIISTSDHSQPQAGGTKVLEAALLMLPAGKCFRAEASGQNWEQRYPTRWSWWLLLVVASTKLSKSWQITNIALRGKCRDFCTANSVSNHFRHLFWLCLKRKVLKPNAQLLILEVTSWKNSECESTVCQRKQGTYIQVQGRTGEKWMLVFCWEQLALSSSHSVVMLWAARTLYIANTETDTSKRGFPHKKCLNHTWGHLSLHWAQRILC